MENKNSYYAIIPANVRYSSIIPNAKLLYGEITALCNDKGFCWASNKYFAELYDVSETTVSLWIKSLRDSNFIKTKVYKNNTRHIYLCEVLKNLKGGIKKTSGEVLRKPKHNNTSNSTTKTFSDENDSLEETTVEACDEGGEPLTNNSLSGGKKKREPKNKLALRIQKKFGEIALKEVGSKPIENKAGYFRVLAAINEGLEVEHFKILFKDWFMQGRPEQELIQITRALSDIEINKFKAENQV